MGRAVLLSRIVYPVDASDTQFRLARFAIEAFGTDAKLKYPDRWNWLYGSGAVSLIFSEDTRIVGHLGCVPFVAQQRGSRAHGVWSVDLHVLRDYRRQGFATQLQRAAQELSPLVVSFWFAGITKKIKLSLGLMPVTSMWVLQKSSHDPKSFRQVRTGPPEPGEIAAAAAGFLTSWDFYVERSRSYCAWRFRDQPYAEYRQMICDEGLALLRRCGPNRRGAGMIGDAYPTISSKSALPTVVNLACAALLRDGCAVVRFGTTDEVLVRSLASSGWQLAEQMDLFAQPSAISGRVFLSLSDQDVDQYPW